MSKHKQDENKKTIYENYELYDPNNKLIGVCGKKRYQWYLSKGLAKRTDNENSGQSKSIQLLFTPKYRHPNSDLNGPLYAPTKRENKCYACGYKENLVKFHVVPPEYKKIFPDEWRSRIPIDVLPLCKDCVIDATLCTNNLKKTLESEYGISKDKFIDQKKMELQRLAKKILNNKKFGVLKEKSMDDIKLLLNGQSPSDEELNFLASQNVDILIDGSRNVYEYIMSRIIKEGKVKEFIRMWKDNFVSSIDPLDLPEDFYYSTDKYINMDDNINIFYDTNVDIGIDSVTKENGI